MHFAKPGGSPGQIAAAKRPEEEAARQRAERERHAAEQRQKQAEELAATERDAKRRLEEELVSLKAKGDETRAEQERLKKELEDLKVQAAKRSSESPLIAAKLGKRWAIVIGIDEYLAVGKLAVCRNDAKALAKVLVENGGYAENRLVVLTDDAADIQNRPTLATMKRRIEQVANLAGKDETVLVYFSGHGITKDGQGYILPMDGDADNAVSLAWVKDTLSKSAAGSKVVILDACHAGSAAKGVSGIAPSLTAQVPGLVMFLSSAADQVSYPDEAGTRSVFSRYVTEGLSGAADSNRDGRVTSSELFDYVRRCMTDWSVKTGKSQTVILAPPQAPDTVLTGAPAATGK